MASRATPDTTVRSSDGLQSVTRFASVLRALAGNPHGLTLSELSETVELPRSTLHRLLRALEHERLVARAPRRWGPGTLLTRLGSETNRTLRDELRPVMQRLSADTGETVDLAVLDGRGVRFIEQIPGPHRLRAVSSVGDVFPLHCTANGKALLACLPRSEATALLTRLPSQTPNTITSKTALWAELDRITREGVAYDREEHTCGICAVGAVVFDPFGPVGAITIPLPTSRFVGREELLAEQISKAAAEGSATIDPQRESAEPS
jgi:DNA-binding IclR family transcriptional regulator